ncbi:MAG TPA: S8 family serine peptidase [Bryobacteraceae bacterium]|nr:S8 family serine peptidase [Bryobacteraceae bacterium]
MVRLSLALLATAVLSLAQSRRPGEYALVLAGPPVARASHSRAELSGVEAQSRLLAVRAAQSPVLAELRRRNVPVSGAAQVLVNAVFVPAGRADADALRAIPGIARVQYLPPVRRDLNTATGLINLPAAYTAVGGASNAGAGIRIGIIDSGIDQNHPGFQDPSLTPPAGFPKGDPNYTNDKVIVARSYVSISDDSFGRADDLSPRDHFGHGTAIAMIAAGVQNAGPQGAIQGVAPKAFLGNYKVFGSPSVNDFIQYSAVVQALTDALADGMDVVTLSLDEGDGATDGPLDFDNGPNGCGGYCDIRAEATENAVANGLVVVASAGNDGNSGRQTPTLSTIHTPGTAPSGITVGAASNAHQLYQAVHVAGPNLALGLQNIRALFGDGPRIRSPLTAPLVDVATLGNDGLACAALPAGSLAGSIALIQRGGSCFLDAKIDNAQAARAIGVILYQAATDGSGLSSSLGVPNTGIPAVEIANSDGVWLKTYLDANQGVTASLDPALTAFPTQQNVVAPFSSRGPSIGLFASTPVYAIKPELVAPGDGIYTATQTLDPAGDGYNASGYAVVSGTSFAVPFVAGAVALVKQKNPGMTPAQLKSAVVNTATQDVAEPNGAVARMNSVGAGKLSVGDAVGIAAAVSPPTLAFGPLVFGSLPAPRTLTLSNVSGAQATFTFAVQARDSAPASVTVSPSTLTLAAGAQSSVTATLAGSLPPPGEYEGFIVVSGAGSTLRVPYQFLVANGVPTDIIPVSNGGFFWGAGYSAAQDEALAVSFRLLDGFGVPVVNQPALFTVTQGGGSIYLGDAHTYLYGLAGAQVNMGPQPGEQIITGTSGGLTYTFDGYASPVPAIAAGGVVNAASSVIGQGLAPGSYISIYGGALADSTGIYSTNYLPVSLDGVFVSFSGGGIGAPGHIHFVSPGQINVQVPWEFQGQSSVQMFVSMNYLYSNVYTLALARYSPGIFANSGNAAVVDANTASVVTAANPARRGDTLELYLNGLGPVTITPPSGEPTPATQPLSYTGVLPTVTIGGVAAQVPFSGLAPGFVGLYQVNAVVPSNAPTGSQPLVVSIGGVSSPAANLPVQ